MPLRALFHPFHAHTLTLLLVIETGTLSLYLIARRLGLSFIESVIIQVFELAVAVALILLLRALPPASVRRVVVTALVIALIALRPNPERFDYERPIEALERWVSAQIAVDPSCRSFFVAAAPGAYQLRSTHMWSLYGIDALFVADRLGIPSLNGYSAWFPEGWALHEPQDPEYRGARRPLDREEPPGWCLPAGSRYAQDVAVERPLAGACASGRYTILSKRGPEGGPFNSAS